VLFLYRLALQIGEWNVDALAARITLDQLRRWMAYWHVEPFGDEWRRAGRMTTMIRCGMGEEFDPKRESKFMPNWREPVQTEEELIAEFAKIPAFAAQLRAQGKIK
jgi:hypothetical protein